MTQQLSRYVPLEVIHRDWLGMTYRAFDNVDGRLVALRLLPPADIGSRDRESFMQALRTALRCGEEPVHPSVAAVYEVGEAALRDAEPREQTCYVATELIQGDRLTALLHAGDAIEFPRVHVWMTQILLGLGSAHRRGMIHSDLNPSNVVVGAGDDIRLLDVGLYSRELFPSTAQSASAGWPAFIAPEQLAGESAGARSDIHAAGTLLYRLLAGRMPFEGSAAVVMQKVLTAEVPPLSQLKPELGSHFDSVVARATARRAVHRFESAEEFLHALNRAGFDAPGAPQISASLWKRDSQDMLTAALGDAVGPMASIIVRDTMQRSTSVEECVDELAAQITCETARATFLRTVRHSAPAVEAVNGTRRASPSLELAHGSASTGWPLHEATAKKLAAVLSEEIGPIAPLLVDRAAARAHTREEFIVLLSEMIPAGAKPWLQALGTVR